MLLKSLIESLELDLVVEKSGRPVSIDQIPVCEIAKIQTDSRVVSAEELYVAIKGERFDPHQVLDQICEKNPAAIVVSDRKKVPKNYSGFVIETSSTPRALAGLASRFYLHPSKMLFCFGVTGTNGKTSCTYLMEKILTSLRLPTGVIGTIEHRLGDQVWKTESTTPGPLELQSRISEMQKAGARALAMEVSSHALVQHRVDGVHFNALLFTNLTRDHLDYHLEMQNYFEAKQRLFTDLVWESVKSPLVAAVNCDDPWGRRLKVAAPAEVITYGRNLSADYQIEIKQVGFDKTKFNLSVAGLRIPAELPMCGAHNVDNAVGCVASALALGVSPDVSLQALQGFAGVPGRLQSVPNNKGIHVFVDYAHSPDALDNVLRALRWVREQMKSSAKIIVVFGCGGDRDKGKRPLMAEVCEKLADQIIITSDNPRTENPQQILQEIVAGFKSSTQFLQIEDRAEALEKSLNLANPGDVVLVAGKGHEDYQIIGTEKIDFSDFATLRGLLQ